jgi:hypothetical protein
MPPTAAAMPPTADETASASSPQAGAAPKPESATRNVAALLAIAAILAALITARASFLSSDASSAWQRALRTDVKRSAAAQEDIRYLYQSEMPIAMKVETAAQRASFMRTAAGGASGSVRDRLLFEADLYDQVVTSLQPASPLSGRPDLAFPGGGIDLAKALADQRNQNPALVALDPEHDMTDGDTVALKARRVTLSTIPIAVGVLLGALAQPFGRRRRLLVALGAVAVGIGALAWFVVEVVG